MSEPGPSLGGRAVDLVHAPDRLAVLGDNAKVPGASLA